MFRRYNLCSDGITYVQWVLTYVQSVSNYVQSVLTYVQSVLTCVQLVSTYVQSVSTYVQSVLTCSISINLCSVVINLWSVGFNLCSVSIDLCSTVFTYVQSVLTHVHWVLTCTQTVYAYPQTIHTCTQTFFTGPLAKDALWSKSYSMMRIVQMKLAKAVSVLVGGANHTHVRPAGEFVHGSHRASSACWAVEAVLRRAAALAVMSRSVSPSSSPCLATANGRLLTATILVIANILVMATY